MHAKSVGTYMDMDPQRQIKSPFSVVTWVSIFAVLWTNFSERNKGIPQPGFNPPHTESCLHVSCILIIWSFYKSSLFFFFFFSWSLNENGILCSVFGVLIMLWTPFNRLSPSACLGRGVSSLWILSVLQHKHRTPQPAGWCLQKHSA